MGVTARQLQLCQSKDEQWSTNERGSKGRDDENVVSRVPAGGERLARTWQVSKQFDDHRFDKNSATANNDRCAAKWHSRPPSVSAHIVEASPVTTEIIACC